ncbi:DUF2786 domain-containing protein [Candidatus Pantoea multigeneris]|uniref:DUF2786 domain-containing protein n=1 Tax=Candidatus Pantoea multigeneris TaxID=2608357 RepID=A0ABX0RAV3_9GAMM|nr:DUF2786 domain-containing protein [Pantoea multigeneris]NIF20609.1 DUF2786 domain-containing protein [Pantoea multigeneris]
MDSAAKKKYLAKIQKLMRLAENTSSPAEAANALSKAQAFMREHGLSESEVIFSEISTSESKSAPSDAEKLPRYMSFLCSTIEKAFAVKCLVSWRLTPSLNRKRVVKFYGLDGRDIAAAYIFDVLTRQIKQARKEFQLTHCGSLAAKRKAQLADQYCEGWASGAYHAVQELIISEEQSSKMNAYSKKLDDEGVGEAKTRNSTKSDKPSHAAYLGYREGMHTKVFHGVDGNNSPALIGLED